jgi:hypothetical protein
VTRKGSPALSRNCKEKSPSQDARQIGSDHSLVDGAWKLAPQASFNPLSNGREFFYSSLRLIKNHFIDEEK